MDPELTDPPEHPAADPADPVPAGDGDDEDLTGSMTALAGLSTARLTLEDLLTRVASFAVQAIPGADGAGLTLIEDGRADTIVKANRLSGRSTTSSTASARDRASAPPRPGRPCGPGR
jgi:hypothetical protein